MTDDIDTFRESLRHYRQQGFYLAKPSGKFERIPTDVQKTILELKEKYNKPSYSRVFFHTVSKLCAKKPAILPSPGFRMSMRS